MKKEETRELRICPICGQEYTEYPALSREDNQTPICPDCGTRQALKPLKISDEEIEEIIQIIHRSQAKVQP